MVYILSGFMLLLMPIFLITWLMRQLSVVMNSFMATLDWFRATVQRGMASGKTLRNFNADRFREIYNRLANWNEKWLTTAHQLPSEKTLNDRESIFKVNIFFGIVNQNSQDLFLNASLLKAIIQSSDIIYDILMDTEIIDHSNSLRKIEAMRVMAFDPPQNLIVDKSEYQAIQVQSSQKSNRQSSPHHQSNTAGQKIHPKMLHHHASESPVSQGKQSTLKKAVPIEILGKAKWDPVTRQALLSTPSKSHIETTETQPIIDYRTEYTYQYQQVTAEQAKEQSLFTDVIFDIPIKGNLIAQHLPNHQPLLLELPQDEEEDEGLGSIPFIPKEKLTLSDSQFCPASLQVTTAEADEGLGSIPPTLDEQLEGFSVPITVFTEQQEALKKNIDRDIQAISYEISEIERFYHQDEQYYTNEYCVDYELEIKLLNIEKNKNQNEIKIKKEENEELKKELQSYIEEIDNFTNDDKTINNFSPLIDHLSFIKSMISRIIKEVEEKTKKRREDVYNKDFEKKQPEYNSLIELSIVTDDTSIIENKIKAAQDKLTKFKKSLEESLIKEPFLTELEETINDLFTKEKTIRKIFSEGKKNTMKNKVSQNHEIHESIDNDYRKIQALKSFICYQDNDIAAENAIHQKLETTKSQFYSSILEIEVEYGLNGGAL